MTEAARSLGVHRTTVSRGLRRGRFYDGLSQEQDADVPVIVRDYSHLPSLRVYPLGDVHLGADRHLAGRWAEWVDYLVSRRDVSMIGTGDFFNAGIVGSKSEVYDETTTVGDARRLLTEQLRPLSDRLDLLVPGNHEDRIFRAVGICPVRDVADFLEVPYAKAAAMVVYRVGDQEYEFYVRHGTGNGQSLAQLAKGAGVARADVYVTGHTHRQAATSDDFMVREGARMVYRHRYFVSSGSFLGYEKYAAARGYVPTRIGAPRVFLDGRSHDVHVSI